ncbi:MAG: hypothetical protein Q9228_001459 [Teloschistes exilis]
MSEQAKKLDRNDPKWKRYNVALVERLEYETSKPVFYDRAVEIYNRIVPTLPEFTQFAADIHDIWDHPELNRILRYLFAWRILGSYCVIFVREEQLNRVNNMGDADLTDVLTRLDHTKAITIRYGTDELIEYLVTHGYQALFDVYMQ